MGWSKTAPSLPSGSSWGPEESSGTVVLANYSLRFTACAARLSPTTVAIRVKAISGDGNKGSSSYYPPSHYQLYTDVDDEYNQSIPWGSRNTYLYWTGATNERYVRVGVGGYNSSGSTQYVWVELPANMYTLSISAGAGSSISVSRTSSGWGNTGTLNNGASIYEGDVLRITYSTTNSIYSIISATLNGSPVSSGTSHTVAGNVTVATTTQMKISDISATDASIGSASTIVITRYDTSFTHTITYSFQGSGGTATGTVVANTPETVVSWTLPNSFYSIIPNAASGTCVLTLSTLDNGVSIGTSSCSITVTAPQSVCAPTVSGTVVDVNPATVSLTGNSSVIVRHRSTARCTITASANGGATLTALTVNGAAVSGHIDIANVTDESFIFQATDSRGYSTSTTVQPTVIQYVNLTCNPILTRVNPTGGEVRMSVTGDLFRGSFGVRSNTLTLRYRYRKDSVANFGSWNTVPSASIVFGSDNYTVTNLLVGSSFDYRDVYVFQVQAIDGANGVELTNLTKTINLQGGVPVFDWGKDDVNFHVPIKLGNTTLTEAQLIQLLALIS